MPKRIFIFAFLLLRCTADEETSIVQKTEELLNGGSPEADVNLNTTTTAGPDLTTTTTLPQNGFAGVTTAGPLEIDTQTTTVAPATATFSIPTFADATTANPNLTLAEEVVHLDASKGKQEALKSQLTKKIIKHKNETTGIAWVRMSDVEKDYKSELPAADEDKEDMGDLCPETRNGISNEARIAVVDFHNRMRTRLAQGKQRDKRSIFAPPGRDLLKMMYDCDIEANAQSWADACKHRHTDGRTRRMLDIGENLAWIPGNRSDTEHVTFSSFLWWREVESIGIGNDTTFLYEFLQQGLGHYTQMAWHGSFRLGCGMNQCNDWMYVVCQYTPRGNGPEGRKIYTIGDPCKTDDDCPGHTKCLEEEALLPILPEYLLRLSHPDDAEFILSRLNVTDESKSKAALRHQLIESEGVSFSILYGSKTFVQLWSNFLVGPLTNRIGYSMPLFIGFVIMTASTMMFAFGNSYIILLLARSLQGAGSACTATAGMALLAGVYTDEKERSWAMGIALGAIAIGGILGPPYGGTMYDMFGKELPFILLAIFGAIGAGLQLWVLPPKITKPLVEGTPSSIKDLLGDPYVVLALGLFDAAVYPMLGYLVEIRHQNAYGLIYAMLDAVYCIAMVIGPFSSGKIVQTIGFSHLTYAVVAITLASAPFMIFLRNPPVLKSNFETQAISVINSDPSVIVPGKDPEPVVFTIA